MDRGLVGQLPADVMTQCLLFLPVADVGRFSGCCRATSRFCGAPNTRLWQPLSQRNLLADRAGARYRERALSRNSQRRLDRFLDREQLGSGGSGGGDLSARERAIRAARAGLETFLDHLAAASSQHQSTHRQRIGDAVVTLLLAEHCARSTFMDNYDAVTELAQLLPTADALPPGLVRVPRLRPLVDRVALFASVVGAVATASPFCQCEQAVARYTLMLRQFQGDVPEARRLGAAPAATTVHALLVFATALPAARFGALVCGLRRIPMFVSPGAPFAPEGWGEHDGGLLDESDEFEPDDARHSVHGVSLTPSNQFDLE